MDQGSDLTSDFRARRIRTQITWVTKDGGVIQDSLPRINSPGQAPVEHAPGLSGSRTKLQWVTHEASVQHAPGLSGVGGGGVVEPWASSDFVRKSWESSGRIPSSPQNSGKIWEFASSDGTVRGCTNHVPRTVSCDSAACED